MSYSAPPPPGSPPQPGYQPSPPSHPQAAVVLVLGIVGLVICGGILSPVAWIMGNRVVAEIDAAQGGYGGRDLANIGRILGIVGTVLLVLAVVGTVLIIALFATTATVSS